jgi:EpsI family protein
MKKFGKEFYIAAALLVVGIILIQWVLRRESPSTPLKQPITDFTIQIGSWQGEQNQPFAQKVLDILRVDNYLNRVYRNEKGDWISLYIGYFQDQKNGETVHSPRNCMPGSGWNFTQTQAVTFDAINGKYPIKPKALRAILVNGKERMLTYYWFQGRGRFLTSEYWQKIYMVLDSIRYNRTDEALVRVLAPLPQEGNIDAIEAQLKEFIVKILPILQYDYLPNPPAMINEE